MQSSNIIKLTILLALSFVAEATTRAGRASSYSSKFRRSTDNTCGITKESLDARFSKLYAAVSTDDVSADEACGKCIAISDFDGSLSARRFTAPGLFVKIVDVKDKIPSGSLRLSNKAMKVSKTADDMVSWTIVDCPAPTNLRGRKMAASETA